MQIPGFMSEKNKFDQRKEVTTFTNCRFPF